MDNWFFIGEYNNTNFNWWAWALTKCFEYTVPTVKCNKCLQDFYDKNCTNQWSPLHIQVIKWNYIISQLFFHIYFTIKIKISKVPKFLIIVNNIWQNKNYSKSTIYFSRKVLNWNPENYSDIQSWKLTLDRSRTSAQSE